MVYRGLMFLAIGILLINISSALCTITPTLINQDPIEAVPGETVKLLFQVTGVENPECGLVTVEFIGEYPFSLDPSYSRSQTIRGGTYTRDFNSFWMIPYKVRVDPNSLDGNQLLRIRTSAGENAQLSKINDFNISVHEVRTDFIVTIDSYSFSTKKLSLGIVNIGEKNAQAVTLEIPTQENAMVEGGHVKILGELDSNEDTTVTFDAALNSGPVAVNIEYNDEIGERRTITKEITFSEVSFENTREKSSISLTSILVWVVVIGIIIYLFISRRNRARRRNA